MMLTDLADVLRAAGCDVMELPGWKTRSESDGRFEPLGILLHHDAMGLGFNANPKDDLNVPKYMSQDGVNGAQLWVSRRGLWVILAAGRKWHAGLGGGWRDVPANSGNTYLLGVETDHTDGNPWEPAQVTAINVGCRAIVKHYGWNPANSCGHLEYAPGRKHDPSGFDLNAWRHFLASNPFVPGGPGKGAPTVKPPKPAPAPKPTPAPAKHGPMFGRAVPALIRKGSGQFYGSYSGGKASHGGYYASEKPDIKLIQQQLIFLGFVPGVTNVNSGWADGIWDGASYPVGHGPTSDAMARFQRKYMPGTTYFGQCWFDDWAKLASF